MDARLAQKSLKTFSFMVTIPARKLGNYKPRKTYTYFSDSVLLDTQTLLVAGARLELASGAYGAPRKTFPNPPAMIGAADRARRQPIIPIFRVNCQNKRLVPSFK